MCITLLSHSIIRDIPPSTKLYASYQILSHPDCNDNLEDLNGNDLEEENFFGRFLSQIAGPNTDEKTKGGGISLDKAQIKITIIIVGALVFLFLIMWLCGKCQKKTQVTPATSKMANNEMFPPEILVLDNPAMSHLSTYSNHETTTAIVEKTEMIPPEILEEILQFQENTLEKTKAELEKVKDERNNLEKQLAEIIFAQNIPNIPMEDNDDNNGNNITNNESILNRMILDCDKIIYELNEKIESLKQEEDERIDNEVSVSSSPKAIPLELLKQIQEGKKLKKAENKNETESAIEISAGVVVQDPRAAIVKTKEALNKTVDNNMDVDDSDEDDDYRNDQNYDDRIQSSHSTCGSSPMDQNGFDIDLLTTEDHIEDSSSPPPCLQETPPPPPYVINVQSEPIFPSAPNSPSSHSSPILPPSSAVSTPSPPPSTPPNPTTPPSPPFTAISSAPPSTPPCSPSSALPSAPPSPSTPPSTAKDLDTPWINP